MQLRVAGVVAVVLGSASPVLAAENPFGTPEAAAVCGKAFAKLGNNWSDTKAKDVDAPCMDEIKKRTEVCLKDPEVTKITGDPKYSASKDPPGYCHELIWTRMNYQVEALAEQQKEAKAAADDQAKLEAREMPKAAMKNPQIEKSIAATYHKAYPDNKILKVVIFDSNWDYEKDALGRVTGRDINAAVVNKHPDGKCEIFSEMWVQQGNGKSYHGPFEERGAGSLSTSELLCAKVK